MSRASRQHLFSFLTPLLSSSAPARRARHFAARATVIVALISAAAAFKQPLAVQASTPIALPAQSAPAIKQIAPGRMAVDISVLTYNVKGLPWPLRLDLSDPDPDAAMAKIGRHLDRLRAQGRGPDIVLIQEGFPSAAREIGRLGHYPFAAHGPTPDEAEAVTTPGDRALAAEADWTRGETQGPVLNSGLHAFSNYPFTVAARHAFGRYACAGFDCLAAKGVLMLAVDIPGVPDPIFVMTLHMNANGASGVAEPRALAAYRLQVDSLAAVLQRRADPKTALIFGGDFNVKKAVARQRYADARLATAGLTAVHVSCKPPACAPQYPAPGDAHWLEPRDIQGYRNGARVHVTPLSSEEMFTGPQNGGRLSDHAGYLVRYRLTWGAP